VTLLKLRRKKSLNNQISFSTVAKYAERNLLYADNTQNEILRICITSLNKFCAKGADNKLTPFENAMMTLRIVVAV
jgi:hypothetical protein